MSEERSITTKDDEQPLAEVASTEQVQRLSRSSGLRATAANIAQGASSDQSGMEPE